jgi:hypothetical protein
MSKPLVPLTIEAPGFLGLNSQNSGSVLPVGWASKLENFVWDDVGRLASRKGTQQINATPITSSPTIRSSFEYIDENGTVLNIMACNNKIYKEVSGTMTDISGTITTPTGDDWQFVNFNGTVCGYQENHAPIVMTTIAGTFADASGTQYNGVAGLSAWGRLWTAVGNTLYYSDLLINNFTGGSAGNFDLGKYWPNGMDEPTALADFNGFLIVFGKNSLIVYENPDDPTVMTIVEGVDGLGCIARDSVQVVGKDLLFLSNTGIRSLGRTIQEKSMPIADVSKNVRDELVSLVAGENELQIKSVYNPKEGFYLLSLPVTGESYLFDLKFPNEDGSYKVGRWDIAPTAMHYAQNNIMWTAVTDGYLSKYIGYRDEDSSAGSGGTSYVIDMEGVWTDFGSEVGHLIKLLKKVTVLASGTPSGTIAFKWAVDYSASFKQLVLNFAQQNPSRFGVATYNTGGITYAAFGDFETIKSSISRSGQVIKIGLTSVIDGNKFAFQRVNLLAKIGKIGL